MMIEKVFIVPHTHTDLGYTADVETVLERHCKILSSLLDLCTNGYEDWGPDRYRWTIEASVILRHWWERASGQDRDGAVALLRSGRWELAGLETQPLTGISDPLELAASVAWACRMGREYGFPIRTVMLNDLGGFARGLPSALSPNGIRYLVLGCGGFRVLTPMAGLPSLFHWEAPDGAKALLWHLGISEQLDPRIWEGLPAQYGFGNSYIVHPTRDTFSAQKHEDDPEKLKFTVEKMDQAYRRLEEDLYRRGYRYRYLMLQASGDNRGLDPEMPKWVDLWNHNIDCPRICVATANEFFAAMVEEYGDDFPVLTGDLHDSCSMLAANNSKGLTEYRSNARSVHLVQAVSKGSPAISEKISEALRWQLWFSDHTFGLSTWDPQTGGRIPLDQSDITSPSPHIQRLMDSWNVKNSYTERAAGILEECKALLKSDKAVTVFVPSEQPTNVIASLPVGSRPSEQDDAVIQDTSDCTWVQWRGLSIGQPGCARVARSTTRAVPGKGSPMTLGSDSWQIGFDPGSGRLVEAVCRNISPNVLAGDGPAHLGDVLVFDVNDMDERPALGAVLHPPKLNVQPIEWTACQSTADGDLVSEIKRLGVIRCPEADQQIQQRWRLYRSSDVLEIDTLWDKGPRVRWEACYFALPLGFENPDVLIHQGLTIAHVGCKELPGCYRDQYSVQDWIAVKGDSCTVMVCPLEAGLVDIDQVRFLQYLTQPISPQTGSLFFLLSHNCWPTNAPCWQGGPLRFRFRMKLLPADVSRQQLSRHGRGLSLGALVTGCCADSMAWCT